MSNETKPQLSAGPKNEYVDLYAEGGDVVLLNKNVGPLIAYHGGTRDLRKLTKEQATEMALDPGCRVVAFKEVATLIQDKRAKSKAEAIEQAKKLHA